MTLLRWWTVLVDEGLYGSLDWMAFTYLRDWYVPHRWFTGCWGGPCHRYGHEFAGAG